MNAWLADAPNLPSHDNGTFNPTTIDPSAAFLNPSPTPDPNQFQQRMFNGLSRNVSPGFQNPNQVIPSKRPRPEDGVAMSPRPAPGGINASRSQTPHQVSFPGYQPPANGTPQFPAHPTPYQHLQRGASPNVTQSPVMQDFDQNSVQRMGTASPSPFSPAGPHVGSQMSPSQSDHPSRVNTPQSSTFMPPSQPFAQAVAPQFTPTPPTMTSAGVQPPMQAPFGAVPQGYQQAMALQQQRLQAMQMQNPARPMNMNPAMMGRPMAPGMNPMAPQQVAALRMQQKPSSPEGFMRSLQKFMMSRNLHLDLQPIVCGRPINLVQLYAAVMKLGGSKKVSAANMWPVIAQQLHFPPMQFQMAVQELREHYARNLAAYEQAFLSTQQKQSGDQMMQQQQPQQPQQPQQQQNSLPRTVSDPSAMQFQSPTNKAGPGFDASQPLAQPSAGNAAPVSNNIGHSASNGFAAPSQAKVPNKPPQHRLSISQTPGTPQDPTSQLPGQPAAQPGKTPGAQPGKPSEPIDTSSDQPLQHPIEEMFKPTVLPESQLHGPIQVDEFAQLGEDISRLKPNVPAFGELGVIDIHALTMSVKSGIHAEIRMALDTLTLLASEPNVPISLEHCDDLVDSLVECAEDQVELLAEHAAEVSDVMLLSSYEEIIRGCQTEWTSLADVPEFGSLDYELDRAVDRLICITTILRNFSFTESNFGVLANPTVVDLIATIIRYLGTRNMLLRTHQNTLDFMKDAVIFLGNLGHFIQLPGKDEAHCLLHFILSFAPFPLPTLSPEGSIMFTPYNAAIHKYTPAATDALAKLLARDDPNRSNFRAIFLGDASSTPQPELLTRAFGLAICAIPDQPRKPLAFADARKVFLLQGLLAADVLAGYADAPLAKSWLESTDGFAVHLLRLSCLMSTERVPPPFNPHARQSQVARAQAEEAYAYSSIINRGLAILRRLAEKSKQVDNTSGLRFPSGIVPKKESLLGALLMPQVDPGVIRQLLTYARLAD